jgi:uncharacterized membrane protein (DUF485 family)
MGKRSFFKKLLVVIGLNYFYVLFDILSFLKAILATGIHPNGDVERGRDKAQI